MCSGRPPGDSPKSGLPAVARLAEHSFRHAPSEPEPAANGPLPHPAAEGATCALTTDLLTTASAEALFASDLSAVSHHPPPDVTAAISHAVRTHGGTRGCAIILAREDGDHPETAALRMRWALAVVQAVYPRTERLHDLAVLVDQQPTRGHRTAFITRHHNVYAASGHQSVTTMIKLRREIVMRIRTLLLAVSATVSLFAVGIAGPAAAAPAQQTAAVSDFSLSYGATVLTGTVDWLDRSVKISGLLKAVSETRQAQFLGYGYDLDTGYCHTIDTRTTPAGTTKGFGFNKICDVNGGFDSFTVKIRDDLGNTLASTTVSQP